MLEVVAGGELEPGESKQKCGQSSQGLLTATCRRSREALHSTVNLTGQAVHVSIADYTPICAAPPSLCR